MHGFVGWDYEDAEKRRQAQAEAEAAANEITWRPPTEDVPMTAQTVQEWAKHNEESDVGSCGQNEHGQALLLQGVGFPCLVPGVLNSYSHVQFLALDFNRLTCFDGLEQLKSLRCLSLRHNRIVSLESLVIAAPPGLVALDLTRNALVDLRGLQSCGNLQSLKVLLLRENSLGPSLACLSGLSSCPSLVNMDLSNNNISETEDADNFFGRIFSGLQQLDLRGNEFCRAMRQYRRRFIVALPQLLDLDQKNVAAVERAASEAWASGGNSAERAVRKRFLEESGAPELCSLSIPAWALPGATCPICNCRHPSEQLRPKAKPNSTREETSGSASGDGAGRQLGKGEKISKWDLKDAGFEAGDDDGTVGWRKMPDFLKNFKMPKAKPKPKAKSAALGPDAAAVASAEAACATLVHEGRMLSLELMSMRGEVEALGQRQQELRSLAAASVAEEEACERSLSESTAAEQLRRLSKTELGEIKSAARSPNAPSEMRVLLETVYYVLTLQPDRPFRRIDPQRDWIRVQRVILADDLVERMLSFSPTVLLSSPALMQHLASLTEGTASNPATGRATSSSGNRKRTANGSAASASSRRLRAAATAVIANNKSSSMASGGGGTVLGRGGASKGTVYIVLHGWTTATCVACRRMQDLRSARADLDTELQEADEEAEALVAPCRSLVERLEKTQLSLEEARGRLKELQGGGVQGTQPTPSEGEGQR